MKQIFFIFLTLSLFSISVFGQEPDTSSAENLDNGARLNIEGTRATLTLSRVSAESLAQFLALARTQAQALPIEAQLQKFTDASAPKTNTPADLWRGTLILSLPGG